MATIKAYTTIEQSRKLAEFLPLESADMEYLSIKENGALVGAVPFVRDDSEVEDSAYSHIYDRIACWSLSALLSVLPKVVNNETLFIETSAALWHIGYRNIYTARTDNPVDACYEMIIKLHELNLS